MLVERMMRERPHPEQGYRSSSWSRHAVSNAAKRGREIIAKDADRQ